MLVDDDHLLFQGDSITNAFRMPKERNDAYQLGCGYAMMVSACLQAVGRPQRLRCTNRGISGDRLAQLGERWQVDCIDVAPTALSLLIGTNDTLAVASGESVQGDRGFREEYASLLRHTVSRLPGIRLILIEPFMLPGELVDTSVLRLLGPRQEAVRQLAGEFGACFVPTQARFTAAARADPAAWIYDGIHPTARGNWLLATAWLETVTQTRLPTG